MTCIFTFTAGASDRLIQMLIMVQMAAHSNPSSIRTRKLSLSIGPGGKFFPLEADPIGKETDPFWKVGWLFWA